jgi:hypothetical protein
MRRLLVGCVAAWVLTPAAADVSAAQQPEVQHLLEFVRTSPCAIVRNGARHPGSDGVRHIQRKYDHFRNDIGSTEDFIERSASQSLLSGAAYQVECPGRASQPTRTWLLEELARYRAQPAKAAK